MNFTTILPGYLYAVDNILPLDIIESINKINWAERSYNRLSIGHNLRRQINYNDNLDSIVNDYCFTVIEQQIEAQCQIKFIHDRLRSFTYWLDEPGFRPAMHIDGNLPSAIQIYLQCSDSTQGTVFYNTADHNDVLYTFRSDPNTGYVMFNQPEADRPKLWHDMSRAVPEGQQRLCLYVTFGSYLRI